MSWSTGEWAKYLSVRVLTLALTLVVLVVVAYVLIFYEPGGEYQFLLSNGIHYHWTALPPAISRTVWQDFHLKIIGVATTRAQVIQSTESTMLLVFGSLIIATGVGLPLGIAAAFLDRHWGSRIAVAFSIAVTEIPPFTIAVLCILVFSIWLHWFPPTDTVETVGGSILPMATLSLMNIGYITKFMQTGMQEIRRRDYLTGARSRGAGGIRMILRHALRPAVGSVVTFFGPQTVTTLIGTLMVQTAFSMPGLLGLLGLSINTQTGLPLQIGEQALPQAVGTVFILGGILLLFNLIIDLVYRWLEPSTQS